MKKEYWIIIIVYLAMQFSGLIGLPLLIDVFGIDQKLAVPIWLIASFSMALLIILFLLRKEITGHRFNKRSSSFGNSVMWAILGVILAYVAQIAAASIEISLGVEMGSENTQHILRMIEFFPSAIIVTSIIGPILEEIVFRKIIFGALNSRFNFFISALISSVIFALAHQEPSHIILYSAMGFTFAFLYVRTGRIIVPIFAHVTMNTLVVLVQSVYKDDIERIGRQAEAVQHFIGGFL